ncbi:MAG: MFS transporter [Atopobiaceae bacterium]|jgi:DHA3 family macrolide efflux protein-like MFS transporter
MDKGASTAQEEFSSNWKTKLALVWGGELVSTITSSVLQMGIIWHLVFLTESANMLSVAMLVAFLPQAILGALAGTIVDRLPLKATLIGSDLAIAAVSVGLLISAEASGAPLIACLIALFLRAVGTTFYTPASQSLTPHLAPDSALTRLAGLSQMMQSGGYILGNALAAAMYPLWGLPSMIGLDIAGALIASGLVVVARLTIAAPSVHSEKYSVQKQVQALRAETHEGYVIMRRDQGLFSLMWVGFVFSLAFAPISALFPLMTLDHFAGTTTQAAVVESAFAGGMILGSFLLTATGGFKNRAISVVFATTICGATTLASGLLGPDGFIAFVALSGAMGVCVPFYNTALISLMQQRIAPDYLGRAFGLFGALMSWAMPVGLVFSSLFADVTGVPIWFVLCGTSMLILSVVLWALPSVRNIEHNAPKREITHS